MRLKLLEGVRVLDLTDRTGHHCGRMLASLGAEVVHVSPAGGRVPRTDAQWRAGQLGKRSITLALEDWRAPDILQRLLRSADVLVESCSPLARQRLGLGFAALAPRDPRLVVCSITPFGTRGPYAGFTGRELTVSAMGGVLSTCGDADRPPVKEAGDACLFHGAAAATLGIVLAWSHRQRTGKGQHVDVSLQEAAASRNTTGVLLQQFERVVQPRTGPRLPFGRAIIRIVWRLTDGYAFFSMATGRFGAPANRALSAWLDELGYENPMRGVDWERYDRSALDPAERQRWEAALQAFFADRTRAEVQREAVRRGITITVALSPREVLAHPQLAARGYFEQTTADAAQPLAVPGYFVRASQAEPATPALPHRPGADNAAVYREWAGMNEEELARLAREGVIAA